MCLWVGGVCVGGGVRERESVCVCVCVSVCVYGVFQGVSSICKTIEANKALFSI